MRPHNPTPRLLIVSNQVEDFVDYRLALAFALRQEGFDVHVALPREPGVEAISRRGLPVHVFHLRRLSVNPWSELRSLVSIVLLFRRLRPDLVLLLCLKPVLYGGIAARLTNGPTVVGTLMGLGPLFTFRTARMRLLQTLVGHGLRFAFSGERHRLVVQNPDDRGRLIACGIARADRTVVIRGSGVDLESFVPTPEP